MMSATIRFAAAACVAVLVASALQDDDGEPWELWPGPVQGENYQEWYGNWTTWAENTRKQANLTGDIFTVPQLLWTQTSFIQAQMHPYDLYFFDPDLQQYTVQRYLDDLITRYGGVDSLLIWPTYTNLGCDDRNQYDMIRALPGHIDGLLNITAQLHSAGVRVLWPYNPWDQGTRYEGSDDAHAVPKLLAQINGDGFNGDTMVFIPENFFTESVIRNHPLALEPEIGGDVASMNWGTMGWGYWQYPWVPGVDRWKSLDTRRMTNVCDRWAKNHTDDLQAAFFNGDGFESWENVWGIWNGLTPRDAEATRRVASILRFLSTIPLQPGDYSRNLTQTPYWVPHFPTINNHDVFASAWPAQPIEFLPNGIPNVTSLVAFTLVNRNSEDSTGFQLNFTYPYNPSYAFEAFDLYHGVKLAVSWTSNETGSLMFDVEGNGFGAVLICDHDTFVSAGVEEFLTVMRNMSSQPLSNYSWEWQYLLQEQVPIKYALSKSFDPTTQVKIPLFPFEFLDHGVEIEGSDAYGIDVQFWWEPIPQKEHATFIMIGPLYFDKNLVTIGEYAEFLSSSGYQPTDSWNFLKNWNTTNPSSPVPYPNTTNIPVTYVSLTEARLYCEWSGKRLPHSYEWQAAGQGANTNVTEWLYPWGPQLNQSLFPVQQSGRNIPGAPPVGNYSPQGDSPFGVSDMVGSVWQYTDEFRDIHTRGVVLRGTSNYRPAGSGWYFRNALELNSHNKYFLMSDSYERAGTIGFRCVADAPNAESCVTLGQPLCGYLFPPNAFTNLSTPFAGLSPYLQEIGLLTSADSFAVAWANWGLVVDQPNVPVRMVGSPTAISDVDLSSGATGPYIYNNNPTQYSWSNGDISATASNSSTAIWFGGNTGATATMTVNLTAFPNNVCIDSACSVVVFVGTWGASASVAVSAELNTNTGPVTAEYKASVQSPTDTTINSAFSLRVDGSSVAGCTGGVLTIQWVKQDDGLGNLTVQSIAVIATN